MSKEFQGAVPISMDDRASKKSGGRAAASLQPAVNSALVIEKFTADMGKLELLDLVQAMRTSLESLDDGGLALSKEMLLAQAIALQSVFMNLSRRAANQSSVGAAETLLRMALKAQNQCRMTLDTATALGKPSVVIARQANIAQGHQQINNGAALARERAPAIAADEVSSNRQDWPNKLMGKLDEQCLVTRSAGKAVGGDT